MKFCCFIPPAWIEALLPPTNLRVWACENTDKWGVTVFQYNYDKYLNSFDLERNFKGEVVAIPEERQIHRILWLRTLYVALGVTICCFFLAYPIAHMLATLPLRYSNLLMICVLLPFWTSLLVRTSSWMVLLQSQGVINDIIV